MVRTLLSATFALALGTAPCLGQTLSSSGPVINGVCGGDLSGTYPACQINAAHLASPLPAAQGGTATINGLGTGASRVLTSLRGASFNSTADQAIALPAAITAYRLTGIEVTNCSTSLTLAAGGFYTGASKSGTTLVAAGQVYTALTGSTVSLLATLAGTVSATRLTASTVYLSLTLGQGSAATCDVYIEGVDLT